MVAWKARQEQDSESKMPKHLSDKLVNGRYAEAMVDCTLSHAVCSANLAEVRAAFDMAKCLV